MKSTGSARKIDELGRIVQPIELKRTLDINQNYTVEIRMEKDSIILTRVPIIKGSNE